MQVASTYVRELYAITEAIKKWRQYLMGRHFRVFTDQRSLKHILTQVTQTPEQHKWAAKLLGYDFEVFYKPGKDNRVADALSRQESHQLIAISVPTSPWLQDLRDYYTTTSEGKTWMKRVSGYQVHNGLIYFKVCLFVPPLQSLRLKLLQEFHSSTMGGYSGITATIHRVNASFF